MEANVVNQKPARAPGEPGDSHARSHRHLLKEKWADNEEQIPVLSGHNPNSHHTIVQAFHGLLELFRS